MRKINIGIILALSLLFLAGCGKSEEKENPNKKYMYYINNAQTKVVFEEMELPGGVQTEVVTELLKRLQAEPKNLSYKRAIPDNVNLPTPEFLGNSKLRLNFDASYNQMEGVQELLRRAAIVKTLCQLDFVDSVEFYVEGNPLTDGDGLQVGALTSSSFIDSFNYLEKQNIDLYYASEDKKKLICVEALANYDGSSTVERIVIDQIIRGSSGVEKVEQYYGQVYNTIPSGTVCNSINTVDYICYVDLNSSFIGGVEGISDELVIYSIVNSLTSLSTINKVKFTIGGEAIKSYGTVANFDQFFEMNYNLIDKTTENNTTSKAEDEN
ncbi:MAG: GerMN domain-containing protein [bacterium]|nr:GerMN domain-containing protein [bacterium]